MNNYLSDVIRRTSYVHLGARTGSITVVENHHALHKKSKIGKIQMLDERTGRHFMARIMDGSFSISHFESDYERKHRLAALKNIQNFASILLQLYDRLEESEEDEEETTTAVEVKE